MPLYEGDVLHGRLSPNDVDPTNYPKFLALARKEQEKRDILQREEEAKVKESSSDSPENKEHKV